MKSSHPEIERPNGIASATAVSSDAREAAQTRTPLITIFTMPKPFGRDTDLIQRNAIASWARLQPDVEVLLIGDEEGIAEAAAELGVRHAGGVEFNEQGTPLVSSAFSIAHRESNAPFLAYCNCDVILLKDFVRTIEILIADATHEKFVAFGQRTDLKVDHEIDFGQLIQIERLMQDCQSKGVPSSNVCKEYFVFNRELYQDVPRFAIGRGNWDNWMIHSAKMQKLPVVNVSALVTAIHQEHGYSHISAGRFSCYVSGDEAQENRRLAGGRHFISGSTPTWRLTDHGLRKEMPLLLSTAFWADIPRFMRLMMNMLVR